MSTLAEALRKAKAALRKSEAEERATILHYGHNAGTDPVCGRRMAAHGVAEHGDGLQKPGTKLCEACREVLTRCHQTWPADPPPATLKEWEAEKEIPWQSRLTMADLRALVMALEGKDSR